jgi:hypothetical protein
MSSFFVFLSFLPLLYVTRRCLFLPRPKFNLASSATTIIRAVSNSLSVDIKSRSSLFIKASASLEAKNSLSALSACVVKALNA